MTKGTAAIDYGRRSTDSSLIALILSPNNPLPHLVIIIVIILASTLLALDHDLNDAVVGIFGAALGASGTALAVQRHLGQVQQAVNGSQGK